MKADDIVLKFLETKIRDFVNVRNGKEETTGQEVKKQQNPQRTYAIWNLVVYSIQKRLAEYTIEDVMKSRLLLMVTVVQALALTWSTFLYEELCHNFLKHLSEQYYADVFGTVSDARALSLESSLH